jgi:hypothetical protein
MSIEYQHWGAKEKQTTKKTGIKKRTETGEQKCKQTINERGNNNSVKKIMRTSVVHPDSMNK